MSGDVQPRKRKDKKRKKDDGSTEHTSSQFQSPSSGIQNEDVNIHVHKEDGTGGGICAKIVFFFLFSALAVLIGLIITEHRGLTDLDTVDQESRFSHLFEGWIDNSLSRDEENHHIEDILMNHENESHEKDEEEQEEEEEEDDEDKVDEEEEEEVRDEEAESEDEEEDEEEEEEIASEEQIQSEEKSNEDNEDEVLDSEEREDNDDESELKDIDDEEVSEEPTSEEQNISNNVENGDDEDDDGDDDDDDGDDDDDDDEDNYDEDNNDDNENLISKEDLDEESVIDKKKGEHFDKTTNEETVDDEEEVNDETIDNNETTDNDEQILVEQKEEENDSNENSRSMNIQRNNHPERSDSDKQSDSDAETYEYENITNKDDFKIRDKIDEAQKNIRNNAAYAIKLFDILLQNYPSSPRSLYGKAQALDVLADRRRSNEILKKAIEVYLQLLDLEDVPDALFEAAADRCINRLRFMGFYNRAINVHSKLIARFPDEPKYPNQLVVSYLTMNRVNKARTLLENILSKYPNDGFALVHYGFILKTIDNKLNESIFYFRKGLATEEPGVIDGRFYFHLGDALVRVGKREEAMEVYEEGVRHKLFLSKYQRSLYNVEHLKGKPWWNKQETPYVELYDALEKNWKRIRDEGLLVLNEKGYFTNEMENLKESGDWKQFELFARGRKNIENCKKCPFTCKLIESIPDARGCTRGQTKFSVMHPGTHVWPHCGPTNCRLRVHLGLQIPMHTYIRVAEEIRSWENGKVFIFDDSFEHEVWHNGTTYRLVLIVDVWHPELTLVEKRTLLPI